MIKQTGIIYVMTKAEKICSVVIWASVLFMVSILIGRYSGYKEGQIDYARGKVAYTIVEDRVIHIMGKAPFPEVELHTIPEEKVK